MPVWLLFSPAPRRTAQCGRSSSCSRWDQPSAEPGEEEEEAGERQAVAPQDEEATPGQGRGGGRHLPGGGGRFAALAGWHCCQGTGLVVSRVSVGAPGLCSLSLSAPSPHLTCLSPHKRNCHPAAGGTRKINGWKSRNGIKGFPRRDSPHKGARRSLAALLPVDLGEGEESFLVVTPPGCWDCFQTCSPTSHPQLLRAGSLPAS